MAFLRHLRDHRPFVPATQAVIGRAPSSALVLSDPRVSSQHARLAWRNGWYVRDLGSRNGTFVDGTRVAPGAEAPLGLGCELQIGDQRWRVVDDSGPGAVAVHRQHVRHARGGLLAVPDDDAPLLLVIETPSGWQVEGETTLTPAQDGLVVEGWTLHLPRGTNLPPTAEISADHPLLASLGLDLRVSLDQEYIEVDVRTPAGTERLPPRTFHDLLLLLARQRLDEANRSEPERGWLYFDDLCKALGRPPRRVNVEVFRARQQLADLGVPDAGGLLERRATTRQIRLGIADVVVRPLA